MYICLYITESIYCSLEISTTLQTNYTSIKENNGHIRNGGWQDFKF